MKNIELVIDDKTLQIPDEITLGMYQEINKNPIKYQNKLHLISLFTDLTIHELKNLNKDQIELIEAFVADKLAFPEDNKLIMTFEHEGIEYGLENDWSKLAWGAWVDFEVYCADDKIYENLHKIMAVLYRPVIKHDKKNPLKYTIEPYKSQDIEARSEIMRFVPVSLWLGAALFFLEIVTAYINSIKSSLDSMTKLQQKVLKAWTAMPKWIQKVLPLDSILPSLTNSQRKMLENLSK